MLITSYSLTLQNAYRVDQSVRDSVGCLMAMPFVPPEELIEVFDSIYDALELVVLDHLQQVKSLYDYFDRVYLRGGGARCRQSRRGRRRLNVAQPRFSSRIWNVYNSVINRTSRTTNVVESWHNSFQLLLNTHHSNLWKFLEHVKVQQRVNEQLITQLQGGHTKIKHPVKSIQLKNEIQIENMVANYEQYKNLGNIPTYLRGISYKLKRDDVREDEEPLSDEED